MRNNTFRLFYLVRRFSRKLMQLVFRRDKIKFYYFLKSHKYKEAVDSIEMDKISRENDPLFLRDLAATFYFSNKKNESTEILKKSLYILLGKEKDIEIKQSIVKYIDNSSVIYKSLGGFSNFGFFLTNDSNESENKRIIKILDNSKGTREIDFYNSIKEVSNLCDHLLYIDSKKGTNLSLLVMKYVDGSKPSNLDVDKVLKLNMKIMNIDKNIGVNNRNINNGFSNVLHEKKTISKELNKIIRNLKYKEGTNLLINDLYSLRDEILLMDFYKLIDPLKHYTFAHNDFHKNNIIVSSNSLYILDWNSFSVSAFGIDMAYFFGNFEFSFAEIKEIYIKKIINQVDSISLVVYCIQQIVIWVKRLHGQTPDKYYDTHFSPIIKYITSNLILLRNGNEKIIN